MNTQVNIKRLEDRVNKLNIVAACTIVIFIILCLIILFIYISILPPFVIFLVCGIHTVLHVFLYFLVQPFVASLMK